MTLDCIHATECLIVLTTGVLVIVQYVDSENQKNIRDLQEEIEEKTPSKNHASNHQKIILQNKWEDLMNEDNTSRANEFISGLLLILLSYAILIFLYGVFVLIKYDGEKIVNWYLFITSIAVTYLSIRAWIWRNDISKNLERYKEKIDNYNVLLDLLDKKKK